MQRRKNRSACPVHPGRVRRLFAGRVEIPVETAVRLKEDRAEGGDEEEQKGRDCPSEEEPTDISPERIVDALHQFRLGQTRYAGLGRQRGFRGRYQLCGTGVLRVVLRLQCLQVFVEG